MLQPIVSRRDRQNPPQSGGETPDPFRFWQDRYSGTTEAPNPDLPGQTSTDISTELLTPTTSLTETPTVILIHPETKTSP